MTTRTKNLTALAQAIDVAELARRLDDEAIDNCAGTFQIAKQVAGANWPQAKRLLEALGAHCDCEIAYNIFADLTEDEIDAMVSDE